MNELSEALKGITDIPIALLSLVFYFLIRKKEEKQWSSVFLLVAVSAMIGALVHIFKFTEIQVCLIWVVLYALLFELLRNFAFTVIVYVSDKGAGESIIVYVIEAALYLVSAAGLFLYPDHDIYFLVVFSAVIFIRVFVCLLKTENAPKDVWVLIILLIFPIIFQVLSGVIPYAVAAEHCVIIAALFTAYRIAKKDK